MKIFLIFHIINRSTQQYFSGNLQPPTAPVAPSTVSTTTSSNNPPKSPLLVVAKKWKDAKNKLVLKSSVFMGGRSSSGNEINEKSDQFEFKDESFRNRRKELMEKAKALEEEAAANNQGDKKSVTDAAFEDETAI